MKKILKVTGIITLSFAFGFGLIQGKDNAVVQKASEAVKVLKAPGDVGSIVSPLEVGKPEVLYAPGDVGS